jgi:hypothetical protein
MEITNKFRKKPISTKVQLAMGLVVAGIGALAPSDSKSTNYCSPGNNGDCVLMTSGDMHCSAGFFWNDCT